MDYKEEYQKALERAKQGLPIDEVFHELKESEDERIRKEMIHWLKGFIGEEEGCGYTEDEIRERIAYLEKQKVQKPTLDDYLKATPAERRKMSMTEILEKEQEPKPVFKVGDKIKIKSEPKYPYREIIDIKNGAYHFDEAECLPFDCQDNWEKEQKPADLSELMVHKEPYIAPVSTPMVADEQKLAEWSEHQHKLLNYAISMTEDTEVKSFLESLRKTSSKMEWSEEDEKAINDLMWCIDAYRKGAFNEMHIETADRAENWLKSLPERFKPQPHWKPSEEQMKALEWMLTTVSMKDGGRGVVLKNLVNDLKKLM